MWHRSDSLTGNKKFQNIKKWWSSQDVQYCIHIGFDVQLKESVKNGNGSSQLGPKIQGWLGWAEAVDLYQILFGFTEINGLRSSKPVVRATESCIKKHSIKKKKDSSSGLQNAKWAKKKKVETEWRKRERDEKWEEKRERGQRVVMVQGVRGGEAVMIKREEAAVWRGLLTSLIKRVN